MKRGLILALCALPFASPLAAQSFTSADHGRPGHFVFAEAETGDWELSAQTSLTWQDRAENGWLPYVGETICHGQSQDISFTLDATGAMQSMQLSFHGDPDERDNRDQITLLDDELLLWLDGEPWHYRAIGARNAELDGIDYPRPEAAGETIILPVWRGHRAVRRSESDPWINVRRIDERLVAARVLAWSFAAPSPYRDNPDNTLPDGWQSHRYEIRNAGLRDAIDWCSAAVASPAARQLPPDLAQQLEIE